MLPLTLTRHWRKKSVSLTHAQFDFGGLSSSTWAESTEKIETKGEGAMGQFHVTKLLPMNS